ncbi:MAG: phosphate signaling complex protein PhoU [Lachnospiraceae bacterium]|nr:phosphate signaling complex protein PhoU [Lachnospiraceae bacterium]MDY3223103.1 phosphate signaling complex protein PhoU [Lachnospiraceae bacterium]
MSPRNVFELELAELLEKIAGMSYMVEEAYENLFRALAKKEREEIEEIQKNDRNINDLNREIERQCLKLITKQQPIARDLRTISSVLKMVSDIERVGDNVSDMAELLLRINMQPLSIYSSHLEGMVTATKELFANAVEAFVSNDLKASRRVIEGDDVIDTLFNKVKNDIIEALKDEHSNADEYIDMMMLAKYLEKIGDHAVNVAEWQIFRETGEIS